MFPKSLGPILKLDKNCERQWSNMRRGLPGPPQFGGAPVTNIRNVKSPHWRPLLGPAHRCLVPFTAFSEYEDASPKGKKQIRWFAPIDRDLVYFAGIWRQWEGDYGSKNESHIGRIFSFLTTEPNELVRPVHAKATPVILGREAEQREWLQAPVADIEAIQARVLARDALEIVSADEVAQYASGYLK
ncbi:MAG: SOS response-associated peptidase family protein [Hyphomonadaceae bacterium]|nr:SOS response-associated peptidase family protein [Hyphomonadaceae bacterium]